MVWFKFQTDALSTGKLALKKAYIITEIAASPDGSPFVLISMVEEKDLRQQQQQPQSPPRGVTVLGPFNSSPDNISNELQKALSGLFGAGGRLGSQVTVIKLDIREYEESGLRVGDKVQMEITRESGKEDDV
jgi:hypothetical protein